MERQIGPKYRSADGSWPSFHGDEQAGPVPRRESGQSVGSGDRRSGEIHYLEEEGRPVPGAVGRLRRTRQSSGVGRNGGLRRLATSRHGGEGAGGSLQMRRAEGGLSR